MISFFLVKQSPEGEVVSYRKAVDLLIVLFYWACLYHGQLTSGQKFSDLRKTVAVNVLTFDWFRGDRVTIVPSRPGRRDGPIAERGPGD